MEVSLFRGRSTPIVSGPELLSYVLEKTHSMKYEMSRVSNLHALKVSSVSQSERTTHSESIFTVF